MDSHLTGHATKEEPKRLRVTLGELQKSTAQVGESLT